MATLTSTYGLALGDLVKAKARAYNVNGYGTYSQDNVSGATI